MDKLPNCKLCGSAPIEIQTFECMKHMCPSNKCTLNHVLFRPDQWTLLMGEDRDEVLDATIDAEILKEQGNG